MENLFKNKTDEELKLCFEQFQEWEKTGVIPDNELGKIRDFYFEKIGMAWHTVCLTDLLKAIAYRWIENV